MIDDKIEDLFKYIQDTDAHLDGIQEAGHKPPYDQLLGFVRDCAYKVHEIIKERKNNV